MAPDEVMALNEKIDKLFGVTRDVQVTLARVATKLDGHEAAHAEHERSRHLTCPTAPIAAQLSSQLDGVAGIQRAHHTMLEDHEDRLEKLEEWKVDIRRSAAVDDAEHSIMFRPFKWLGANAERVMLAVVIAYLVTRFGL